MLQWINMTFLLLHRLHMVVSLAYKLLSLLLWSMLSPKNIFYLLAPKHISLVLKVFSNQVEDV